MATKHKSIQVRANVGDSAVDGLFGGLIGGLVMVAYLALISLVSGQEVSQALARFAPQASPTLISGVVLHLAVSAIYGILYGLAFSLVLHRWLVGRKPIWSELAGAAYGLLLWLAANYILLPAIDSLLQNTPAFDFALAHLAYGAILGWWVLRNAMNRQSQA